MGQVIKGNLLVEGTISVPNNPNCRIYSSGAQTIPDTSFTQITFNLENFDTQSMHDNVTNNSRITITEDGIYLITGAISWVANATGVRASRIYLNGLTNLSQETIINSGGTTTCRFHNTTIEQLSVGDYIEIYGFQNSGGNLNNIAGREATFLSVSKLA